MCYLVTIPEFGDGVTFHIVKKNFQVNVDPQTVFESEAAMGNPIPPPPVDGERASGRNVVPNVFGGAGLREEIEQLRAEGIEVDDDNEPLPEDAEPPLPTQRGCGMNTPFQHFALGGQTTASWTVLGGGRMLIETK